MSIIVLKVEETYLKLLQEKDPKAVMKKRGRILFLQCIKKSCEEFLTKQYGYKVRLNLESLSQDFQILEVKLRRILLQ